MDKYQTKLSFKVQTDENPDYMGFDIFWGAMDYQGLVVLEDILVTGLAKLVEMGYVESIEKGGNPEKAKEARERVRSRS